jgi:hypothetical protein
MSSTPLSPEKRAEIEDLARAIHEAVQAEISELAAHLATTDDAHLFGDNEFQIRALAHRIAAKTLEEHLAPKKTRVANLAGESLGAYNGRRNTSKETTSRETTATET